MLVLQTKKLHAAGVLSRGKPTPAAGSQSLAAQPQPITAEDIEDNMAGALGTYLNASVDEAGAKAAPGATQGAASLAEALNAGDDVSEDGDAPYIAAIARDMERQVRAGIFHMSWTSDNGALSRAWWQPWAVCEALHEVWPAFHQAAASRMVMSMEGTQAHALCMRTVTSNTCISL